MAQILQIIICIAPGPGEAGRKKMGKYLLQLIETIIFTGTKALLSCPQG